MPDTPDNLYSFFLGRVRDRLHVILCFSPVGASFGRRAQQFPGLINGCFPPPIASPQGLLPCLRWLTLGGRAERNDKGPRQDVALTALQRAVSLQLNESVHVLQCRCTIDWFLPWPEEALTEVAGKYIDEFPMACPDNVRLSAPLMTTSLRSMCLHSLFVYKR